MPTLKIACAWCGKVLGEEDSQGAPGGVTSTICDDCLLHKYPHIYEKIKENEKEARQ